MQVMLQLSTIHTADLYSQCTVPVSELLLLLLLLMLLLLMLAVNLCG
jgi:hypothetical protein